MIILSPVHLGTDISTNILSKLMPIVKLGSWSISNLNLKAQKRTRADVIIPPPIPNHTKRGENEEEIGGGKRKYEEVLEEGRGPKIPWCKGPKD